MNYAALHDSELAMCAENDPRFNKDPLFTELTVRLGFGLGRNRPELNRRDGDVNNSNSETGIYCGGNSVRS